MRTSSAKPGNRTFLVFGSLDRTKTNQNEKFSRMEKIQEFATCEQNEKFSKTEKIQKFAIFGATNKNEQTQYYPETHPTKCRKTKESQGGG